MYLLYLDESGNPDDPADNHFILGGIAVFERVTFFLANNVEAIQEKHFPGRPPVDFHASHIRAGKGFWRGVENQVRDSVLQDLAQSIYSANARGVHLFAAVVEKTASLHGEEAIKRATEQVCKRFDTFLSRQEQESDRRGEEKQRGLLLFAESHYKQRAKIWIRGFRELGTEWGVLTRLSDVPYFAPAKENRLLQLADFVAHATYLLYERQNPILAKHIVRRFDQKDRTLHGLVHISENRGSACDCPGDLFRHVHFVPVGNHATP